MSDYYFGALVGVFSTLFCLACVIVCLYGVTRR